MLVDDGEYMNVYLDKPHAISSAVGREPKKKWNLQRLGVNPVVVYDEVKRLLAIASVPGMQVC
jgi:hypothetical protein